MLLMSVLSLLFIDKDIWFWHHQRSDLEYSHMEKATYDNCMCRFQEPQVVQEVLEDLQVHRNQSLVVLVAPGVQEGHLLSPL